jgi:hypothetical protein
MGHDAQGVNEAAAAFRDLKSGDQRTPIRCVAGKGNKNSFHDLLIRFSLFRIQGIRP